MLVYDLKVGYSCNNRCKHCVIEDSKNKLISNNIKMDLTTQECLNQIDEELKRGIKHLVLTGGEVTLRKDFNILLKKCTDNNLGITVQTNGRMLSNDKVIKAINNIDDIRFIVALHGANSYTHDNITQVKGSFEETCQGIRTMIEHNKLVIIKVVISKINILELEDIVKLANNLGVKYICFAFPHAQGGARINFNEVMPTYSNIKYILEKVINKSEQMNVNIEFEAVPFCIIPKHMRLVGELKYLRSSSICTQVKEETFEWDDIRKSIKRKGKDCLKCSLDSVCEGPWSEYIDAFGDDELKPIILSEEDKNKILNAIYNFSLNKI